MKLPLIISACLLGQNTKYNGKNNYNAKALALNDYFDFILICPELEGGLGVPRDPAEIINARVISSKGLDVTKEYEKGAGLALNKALQSGAKYAMLKAKSPSCGNNKIYDGSFTGVLIDGEGVTAKLLKENGIKVFNEKEIDALIEEVKNKS